MTEVIAYAAALGGLAMFLAISKVVLKAWIGKIIEGHDGVWSTSKFQWFLWTGAVIFAYVAVYTARSVQGHHEPVNDIPPNILIALGFSTASAVLAKGITSAYVANGKVVKTGTGGGLLADDSNAPDLSKIQLLSWTVIAIGIYMYTVVSTVHNIANPVTGATVPGLPDIDGALMVLSGLAQGGYLGKKLVTATAPQLTSLTPPSAKGGQNIVLNGSGFGGAMGTSILCLDGIAIPVDAGQWTDTTIGFALPAKHPSGSPYQANQVVQIGVYVNGQPGTSTLALPVSPPG